MGQYRKIREKLGAGARGNLREKSGPLPRWQARLAGCSRSAFLDHRGSNAHEAKQIQKDAAPKRNLRLHALGLGRPADKGAQGDATSQQKGNAAAQRMNEMM